MVVGVVAAVAVAMIAVYVAGVGTTVRAHPAGRTAPVSPLGEAERILLSRYARGMITAEEYDRMMAVLRR